MYKKFHTPRELAVQPGDRVAVQGYRGTVLEVIHTPNKKEWDAQARAYVDIPDTESLYVTVHFDESQDIARYGQYQNGCYGGFTVIDD